MAIYLFIIYVLQTCSTMPIPDTPRTANIEFKTEYNISGPGLAVCLAFFFILLCILTLIYLRNLSDNKRQRSAPGTKLTTDSFDEWLPAYKKTDPMFDVNAEGRYCEIEQVLRKPEHVITAESIRNSGIIFPHPLVL